MALNLGKLYLLISGKSEPLKKELDKSHNMVRHSATAMARTMKSTFSAIFSVPGLLISTGIGYGLARATSSVIAAAEEQENAEKRLGAVLRSTGEAAGFNLEQMKAMAAGLQQVTATGDEVIISAQAILATFKQIRGEAFERTLESALDVSEVMGQDLRTSVIQLGKALNDPIANLGALGRTGIQFTKEQKETIKSLWEMGRAAEAQNVILLELESQFGGAARAARETFAGSLQALKNEIGDIAETIGFALMPPLQEIIRNLSNWIAENQTFLNQDLPEYIGDIASNLSMVVKQIGEIAKYAGLRSIMGTFMEGAKLASQDLIDWNEFVAASFFERQKMVDNAIKQMEELGTVTKKIGDDTPGFKEYVESFKKVNTEVGTQVKAIGDLNKAYTATLPTIRTFHDSWIVKGERTFTDEQIEKINQLKNEYVNALPIIRTFRDSWEVKAERTFTDEQIDKIKEMNKVYNDTYEDILKSTQALTNQMSDYFTDFVMTGKLSFKDLANSILRDLVSIQSNRIFTNIFSDLPRLLGFGAAATGSGAEIKGQHGAYLGEGVVGFGRSSGKSYEFHPNEYVVPYDKMGGRSPSVEVNVVNNLGVEADVRQTTNQVDPNRVITEIVLNEKMHSRSFRRGLRG